MDIVSNIIGFKKKATEVFHRHTVAALFIRKLVNIFHVYLSAGSKRLTYTHSSTSIIVARHKNIWSLWNFFCVCFNIPWSLSLALGIHIILLCNFFLLETPLSDYSINGTKQILKGLRGSTSSTFFSFHFERQLIISLFVYAVKWKTLLSRILDVETKF